MKAVVFDGRRRAGELFSSLQEKFASLTRKPVLELISIGFNPIAGSYLNQTRKAALDLGVGFKSKDFGSQVSFSELTLFLERENRDKKLDFLLIQVASNAVLFRKREAVFDLVAPDKDVDFLGKTFFKNKRRLPSVCRAVLTAVAEAGEHLSFYPQEAKTLVVGNQGFWGRRIQQALVNQGFSEVMGIDKETVDLASTCQEAEVLISCVGWPSLIGREMVKKGAALIDVGFSYSGGRLVGDIDFGGMVSKAGFITPVPGGIGPLATLFLFDNLIQRWKRA
jgi:methylenetetrahydrofolate dehydrogenase (NADP+)/methenyltetrahydrofolate cyclohydrolase